MRQPWQRVPGREDLAGLQVVVGLGNPGRRYARNRHNVGFWCVEALAQSAGLAFNERKFRAELARGQIDGVKVLLVKPQTYMNLSGEAVAPLLGYYRCTPADLLVIYDDLDLPLGALRLRPQGRAGGHKGMQSIIQHLQTPEFARLRLGIGRPPEQMDVMDYVLQSFGPAERAVLDGVIPRAVDAVRCVLADGLTEAMNRFNRAPDAAPVEAP